ncbi:MAG: SDR family NAD(P)-dependent oxidoreductase [Planctomycetota bacterium]
MEDEVLCYATWTQNEGKTRAADLIVTSQSGSPLLRISGLNVQQVSLSAMRKLSASGAQSFVYELNWELTRIPAGELESKCWLVVEPDEASESVSSLLKSLESNLLEKGHRVEHVQYSDITDSSTQSSDQIEAAKSGWIEYLAFKDNGLVPKFDGVIWLVDSRQEQRTILDGSADLLIGFVQALIENGVRKLPCGIQIVTSNAISTESDSETQVIPRQSKFWGLGRVLAAEQPELRLRLLDLVQNELSDSKTVTAAIELTLTETASNQHAIRGGQVFQPRLELSHQAKGAPFQSNQEGCYLITGGLGMLGRRLGQWLADKGAGQVVLLSRRKPDEKTLDWLSTFKSSGCEVLVQSADVGSKSEMDSLFQKFGQELKPLKGVIHAAGVLDDGLIESQSSERFEKVLRPKITGSRILDQLTRDLQLDLFVLYSSAASILGSPGQANYAMGNAFMDGLAVERKSAGLPALSINWGPLAAGMADDERIVRQMKLQGITPLEIEESHSVLERMLVAQVVNATVIDADWRKMRTGPQGTVPELLKKLAGSRSKGGGGDSALVVKLRSLKGAQQRELLISTLQKSLQGILSTPELPETDRPLIEMGLDSLMAVEFGTELQQMLGDQFNVGPTMLFDHPTIDAIGDYVLELVESSAETSQSFSTKSEATQNSNASNRIQEQNREDIAIVGMSCRFPGAKNHHEFWQNLLDGVDSVRDIPEGRWDVDRFYSAEKEPGKMYTKSGGFIDDIAEFDASFFNISDQEACWIDPQHRMLLENSYLAMEDAGIPVAPLADSNVGVFMGIMGSDYAFLPSLDDDHIIKGFQGAGLSHSAGVGRISYLFGFEGPSVSIDTASSSSLVAVYQAMRSLQEGNCNLALAGGVNAILVPVNSLLMSKAGLLSPDGRCKSFSKQADGFGRGEGCGVVVLKRLSDAQRDGDRVMAVIRGGAVVHNGFSTGITAPSGKAQSRVISAAVKDARIAPSDVQYLEAHGTGTEFGDAMELGAAVKVYGKGRKKENSLLVGSVKANISHLEAAGGSSGLIKTVLAIHHGVIPQQIHWNEPSQHIPWKRMPLEMVTENRPWPECDRRTAGITALGLVGTNAHLIVSSLDNSVSSDPDERQPVPPAISKRLRMLALSARCSHALQQQSKNYADFLENHPETNLDDFCMTLNCGRKHFEKRQAVTFSTLDEAVEKLRNIQHDPNSENGKVVNGNGAIRQPASQIDASAKLFWIFDEFENYTNDLLGQLESEYPVIQKFLSECKQRRETSEFQFDATNGLLEKNDDRGTQVSSFLLQACIAKLFESWGIQPDLVAGFGVGQYVASCVAGVMDYLDALELISARERIQDPSDLDELKQFETFADQFNFYPPNLPLICSLTGEMVATHRSLGGSYWREHLANGIQIDRGKSKTALLDFGDGLGLLVGDGDDSIERSLDKKLQLGLEKLASSEPWIHQKLFKILGHVYTMGQLPNFKSMNHGRGNRLSLPTYPFQKQRYWITEISNFMTSDELQETS